MKEIDHIFLSTQELGSLLGVTRQTIRNWIKKGDVKAFHIGQNLKIPASEAVRILMQCGLPVPSWLGHGDLAGSKPVTRDDKDKASVSWPAKQTEGDNPRQTGPGLWHRVM
jgi:excisionase family DNA binding protein